MKVYVRPLSDGNPQTLIQTAIRNDDDVVHNSVVYDNDLTIQCIPRELLVRAKLLAPGSHILPHFLISSWVRQAGASIGLQHHLVADQSFGKWEV